MKTTIDLSAECIDVRDIIERIEELEQDRDSQTESSGKPDSWAADFPEDAEELATLVGILDDLKGNGGDEQWRGDWYPVTLIRDTYWEDYARELAEDIGAITKDARWPNRHIDWEAAANELQMDYTSTEIEGTDYWYR